MKVKDVMQSSVPSVEDTLQVKNLARLIVTTNIPGFPVVKNKKLVGFITEEDIFFSIHDSGKKFKKKETPAQILEMPVRDIMVKNVMTVTPDTDLVEAQILMYKNNFTRLPVVDTSGNFLGGVTRADIYRHVLEEEIPKLEEGQYASFVLENYDQMVEWDKRFDFEFPTLLRIFNRHNARKILELGIWTGEYAIGLVNESNVEIVGLDHNETMVQFANSKKARLPSATKNRVVFKQSDYKNINALFKPGSFDAAICMGGVLPYLPVDPEELIKDLRKVLRKGGVVVIQLLNLERVIEKRRRFLYFKIVKAKTGGEKEEMYIEFFDKKNENTLIHNVINFTKDGKTWIYRGVNSIEINYIKNNQIEKLLKKAGFKDITVTGNKGEYKGAYGQMSLVKPYEPESSDWMTIIANT